MEAAGRELLVNEWIPQEAERTSMCGNCGEILTKHRTRDGRCRGGETFFTMNSELPSPDDIEYDEEDGNLVVLDSSARLPEPKAEDVREIESPAFEPHRPGVEYRPGYYKPARTNKRISPYADVWDVVHAWGVNDNMQAMAIKYLLRAGRKAGNPWSQDVQKAIETLQRALSLNAGN